MSQSSSEKYLYFTVGLLKNSSALESLWQDALKHHMVDQPGQLIALRLTEYYEMMSRGIVQPVVQVPAVVVPVASEGEAGKEETAASPVAPAAQGARTPSTPLSSSPAQPQSAPSHQVSPTYPPHAPHIMSQPTKGISVNQITGRMRAFRREDGVVFTSPDVEQNADEAADYWATL